MSEPVNWTTDSLGNRINLKRGYDLPNRNRFDGDVPIYSSSGVSGFHSQSMCTPPGVITGRYGTIGQIFFATRPYWPLNTTLYVQDFKGNNEKFIYYFLQTLDWEKYSDKSAVPGINRNDVHQEIVCLPPLPEQRAIASVLSSLDDKIDLLHRQNKTLEAMAETLFRQALSECQTADMTLDTLVHETIGGDWGKEFPEAGFDTQVSCVRGTDLAHLRDGLPNKTPIRFVRATKLERIAVQPGDVIFEISGGTETQSTGRAAIASEKMLKLFEYPLVFSNFCRLFRPKVPDYGDFLYMYLLVLYDQSEFFALENGSSGIKNLNYKTLLSEFAYPIPSDRDVLAISSSIRPYLDKFFQNKMQIRTLEKLRDTLLPKLMSGEVRVQYE